MSLKSIITIIISLSITCHSAQAGKLADAFGGIKTRCSKLLSQFRRKNSKPPALDIKELKKALKEYDGFYESGRKLDRTKLDTLEKKVALFLSFYDYKILELRSFNRNDIDIENTNFKNFVQMIYEMDLEDPKVKLSAKQYSKLSSLIIKFSSDNHKNFLPLFNDSFVKTQSLMAVELIRPALMTLFERNMSDFILPNQHLLNKYSVRKVFTKLITLSVKSLLSLPGVIFLDIVRPLSKDSFGSKIITSPTNWTIDHLVPGQRLKHIAKGITSLVFPITERQHKIYIEDILAGQYAKVYKELRHKSISQKISSATGAALILTGAILTILEGYNNYISDDYEPNEELFNRRKELYRNAIIQIAVNHEIQNGNINKLEIKEINAFKKALEKELLKLELKDLELRYDLTKKTIKDDQLLKGKELLNQHENENNNPLNPKATKNDEDKARKKLEEYLLEVLKNKHAEFDTEKNRKLITDRTSELQEKKGTTFIVMLLNSSNNIDKLLYDTVEETRPIDTTFTSVGLTKDLKEEMTNRAISSYSSLLDRKIFTKEEYDFAINKINRHMKHLRRNSFDELTLIVAISESEKIQLLEKIVPKIKEIRVKKEKELDIIHQKFLNDKNKKDK